MSALTDWTPEQHAAEAQRLLVAGAHTPTLLALAQTHASLANAKALLQFPICGHGNRGFCQPCFDLVHSR